MQTAYWQIISHRVTYTNIYYIYLYLYLYLCTYTYTDQALVWLTDVQVWLTQARVCKYAVCICRTPLWKWPSASFDRSVCIACKSSLLNICAVKEQLIFNIVVCLSESVVLYVIHLLRSQSKELKQSPLIDRWPLILFEKLWKPSTAFTAYVRKILRQRV